MSRLDNMDYTADFLRGWPNEGAIESSNYTIATGVDLEAGDLVVLDANGELVLASAEDNFGAIVVRGNLDDKSVSGTVAMGITGTENLAPNKAIVLWGGYIVRTQKIEASVAINGVPMDKVITSVNGTFIRSADATASATFDVAGVDGLGYILEIVPAAGSTPASAVIVVK